jgi:N-acetyl-alpha-D-muramate 1-phosphate uridylyltransferase
MLPVAILAGGLGTRVLPLTGNRPKALIDVDGEPFVTHQLRLLRARGIARVVMCIGALGEHIVSEVGDGSRLALCVSYSHDGPAPLGTGGALRKALPQLGESFFVLYGDSYLECDYRRVQAAFQRFGAQGLMTVFRNENRWQPSNVEIVDGRIVAYSTQVHTRRMRYIDYGLSVLRRTAFTAVAGEAFGLDRLFGKLLAARQLAALEVDQRFYEVGSPAGLEELRAHLLGADMRGAPP